MARKVQRLSSYLKKACPSLFGSVENGKKVSWGEMQSLAFQDFTGEAKKNLGLVVDWAKMHPENMIRGVLLVGSAVMLTNTQVEKGKRKKRMVEMTKCEKRIAELDQRDTNLFLELKVLNNEIDYANEELNALRIELDGLVLEWSAIQEVLALDEKEVMLEDDLDALVERQEVLHADLAAFKERWEANQEELDALFKKAGAILKEKGAVQEERGSVLETMKLLNTP